MTPAAPPSKHLAFIDECGDHGLKQIDPSFPLFVLAMVVIERAAYRQVVLPRVNAFKLTHWDHEGVNLHSHEIRKAKGDFRFLQNRHVRPGFLEGLSTLIEALPFELFVVAIRKDRLSERYAHADNPYDIALTYLMERVARWMRQNDLTTLPLVAEARGKREDHDLQATFSDLLQNGTDFVGPERFRALSLPLEFRDKRTNIAGIQIADLCAYPASRHVLKPDQPNRAFEAVRPHLARGVQAWKVFPE